MCGIAGIISKTGSVSVKETVFAMSQAIKHRGPDGEGFAFFSQDRALPVYSLETPELNTQSSSFLYNPSLAIEAIGTEYPMAFAHRRLSIIDLSEAGHQPMCDNSGNYWLTFNGEIYNYIELREELKQKGHSFVTQTDTEVLLEAYKEWGMDCLQKFNGMFAFALFDKKQQTVFCARDRVGVKPFYFIHTAKVFAFASEYKAFLKSGLVNFEINEPQQFDFIVNANLETGSESLFKHIKELKPSHHLLYNLQTQELTVRQYYSLPETTQAGISNKEVIEKIEEKLVNSIRLRLRSDVEVGACLSGGLDSSIIAGIIHNLQPDKTLKLFTAVFPDEAFDESGYAKSVAESVKGNWKTVSPTSSEFFKEVESLNYFQDLPVWSTSTYSQHRVMKLAAQNGVKVVLDGQGADELFAGYSHHYMALWKETPALKLFSKINQAGASIPSAYRLFSKQLAKDAFGLSVNYAHYFIQEKKAYGKSSNEKLASGLNEQLQRDYNGRLKSFLKCEDRCSMAFGIESRVPFADDVELVDYIFSIEGSRKIKNGISKYLLREAAQLYIPQKIYLRRDKVGFETPVARWFQPHKQQVLDTIISQLDFIDRDVLAARYERLLLQKPTFLLRLYSFSVWKTIFSQ